MDVKLLNREHLETLSSADLIELADEFGIDIPDNLNRSFIIGELLEVAEEFAEDDDEEMSEIEDSEAQITEIEKLPESYNETTITVLLRNPAWIYTFWDIKSTDIERLTENDEFNSLCLRVSYWENVEDSSPLESFDVRMDFDDRHQYILLSPNKNFVRVDLVALFDGNAEEILTVSEKVELLKSSKTLNSALPGREIEFSKAVELSDIRELLKFHFANHRQSFFE